MVSQCRSFVREHVQEHLSLSHISIVFPPSFSPHNINTATFDNTPVIEIITLHLIAIHSNITIMHDDNYLSFIDCMEIAAPFALDDGSLDAFMEDDTEEQKKILFLLYLSESERTWKYDQSRLRWDTHVAKLQHEGLFSRTYRMSHDAFVKMLNLLRTKLTCDCARSTISCSDPIYPELVMAIGLRYLAGGSYIDIRHAYHISVSSLFRCRDIFFNAVNTCPELEISFPETPEAIDEAMLAFKAKLEWNYPSLCWSDRWVPM